MSLNTRIRLSAMMFLQYMMLAVWLVQLAAYLGTMKMSSMQIALIANSMALGCLASPLIGMIADRHFPSQAVLAVLNLVTGAMLILSAQMTSPMAVFICLLLTMLCYMPTWGLTSSIAMSHSPSDKFPQIRVFGSIGWVAAGLFSIVAGFWNVTIDGKPAALVCGGVVALVGGVFAFFLPHTPPPAKGQKASIADVLGLRSLVLMKDPQFAMLIFGTFIGTIAFASDWTYFTQFLQAKGYQYLTVTKNWGQVAEMALMLTVPLVIAKVGLKWTMVLGLSAMVVRYAAYSLGNAFDADALYYVGILVHGIIFGFFYVGGQIYADRKAPKEMKAQAQGLLFLIAFGAGMFIGNFINAALLEMNVPKGERNWQAMWVASAIIAAVVSVVFAILVREPSAAAPEAGQLAQAKEEVTEAEEKLPAE